MRTTCIALLTTLFVCCFYSLSRAQLDSVSVSAVVLPVYTFPSGDEQQHVAALSIYCDDLADLGRLSVVVYDELSGTVIGEFVRDRNALTTEGLLLSDHVEWPLLAVEPGRSYRLEVSPQNLEGAYARLASLVLVN